MKSPPPPLRFLCLVVGGWACLRISVFASGWWEERPDPPRSASTRETAALRAHLAQAPQPVPAGTAVPVPAEPETGAAAPLMAQGSAIAALELVMIPDPQAPPPALGAPVPAAAPPALAPPRASGSRWSLSAWLFLRDGRGGALAPGGTLGGSQAGGRISYRLNGDRTRPVALSVRAYAPVDDPEAAEAALGLDWRPLAGLPLNLLAERRQALGSRGRSAFALTVYGGVSDEEAGPLRLDVYGQAGIVGARSRDAFADGSARLGLPFGRARVGAGLWAAAQPGAARLDVGPQASFRLPVGDGAATLAADWRFRVAGDAAPGSGPALTISTEF